MNRNLRRILPIFWGLIIIVSMIWYLFVYDNDFTRDVLMQSARYFESQNDHTTAAWLYDQAYIHSGYDEQVAIALAEHFKQEGNYTQAEATLSKAIARGGSSKLYIALCKTYVEQDKLLDAVTMLDNILSPTIREEIALLRPEKPEVDIPPNFYNQYLTITVSGGDHAIYLTTDGSYPSTITDASDGKVTLTGGENILYAVSISDSGLVSPLAIFGYTISGVIEEVTFTDAKIDAAVRQALGIGAGETLFSNDLWTITELTLPEGADHYGELSHLIYLQSLTISQSNAPSLEGIEALTGLKKLKIYDAALRSTDLLTVASLPNLQELTLSGCSLSSIENLSALENLTYLDLSDNSIRDFSSLSFMSHLTTLNLSKNALTDVNALSGLQSLQWLDISYNALTSISPLAVCKNLTSLNISNNTIADLTPLQEMLLLTKLDCSFNAIISVEPLSPLTELTDLNIGSNQISDIAPLASLTKLQYFNFSRNSVTALPAWNPGIMLISVDGSYNDITSLQPLFGCSMLNLVLMDYNSISDVSPLAYCYSLIKVSIYGNPVSDVSVLTDMSVIVNYNPLA